MEDSSGDEGSLEGLAAPLLVVSIEQTNSVCAVAWGRVLVCRGADRTMNGGDREWRRCEVLRCGRGGSDSFFSEGRFSITSLSVTVAIARKRAAGLARRGTKVARLCETRDSLGLLGADSSSPFAIRQTLTRGVVERVSEATSSPCDQQSCCVCVSQ